MTELLLASRLPDSLLPETWATLAEWTQRQLQRPVAPPTPGALSPRFPFQPLPPTDQLSYELVDWSNFAQYLPLFESDLSPFVDERFRHRAGLEDYAAQLLTDMRHSWKRAGCDWLLRRRSDGQPVGVLHLFELSHEVIGSRVPACCVGYAIAEPFRRQGLAREALTHLLHHAATLFGRTEARALVAAGNHASQALLRSCGFVVLEDRPASPHRPAEGLWQRQLS